jgi:hypothetical protein
MAIGRQRALDCVGDGRLVLNDQDPQLSSSVPRLEAGPNAILPIVAPSDRIDLMSIDGPVAGRVPPTTWSGPGGGAGAAWSAASQRYRSST